MHSAIPVVKEFTRRFIGGKMIPVFGITLKSLDGLKVGSVVIEKHGSCGSTAGPHFPSHVLEYQ